LVVEIKEIELRPDSNFDLDNNKRRQTSDAKCTAIVVTATIQPEELEDP
jgi:hypothetical protein